MAKKPPVNLALYAKQVDEGYRKGVMGAPKGTTPRYLSANPVVPASTPGGGYRVANGRVYSQSDFQPVLNDAQQKAKEILGKQGITFDSLDYKTQQAIRNTSAADVESMLMGKPRKRKPAWWERGLDILSRPTYAVAEATKEGFQRAADPHKNTSLLDTAGSFLHGAEQGFTGKKKVTFSDVIQNIADAKHAASQGRDIQHVKEGEGHVNKVLKYGGGLALDVGLDPTTYMGVGLITKGLKGPEAIKQIEKTAKAAKALEDTGKVSKKAAHKVLAAHLAPVENLSKKELAKLSPAARDIADVALKHQASLGRRELKKLRSAKGEGSGYLGKTLSAGSSHTVEKALKALEDGSQVTVAGTKGFDHSHIDNEVLKILHDQHGINPTEVKTWLNKGLGMDGALTAVGASHLAPIAHDLSRSIEAGLEKQFGTKVGVMLPTLTTKHVPGISGLTETMLGNAAPIVKKQLALRIAKTHVPIPGVATGVGKAAGKLNDVQIINQATSKFNDLFRAKAGIGSALSGLRNKAMNGMGQGLVAYGHNLRGLYDGLDSATRKGILASIRDGATEGSKVFSKHPDLMTGNRVNLAQHFQSELARLSDLADQLHVLPEELNHLLPKAYHSGPITKAGFDKHGNPLFKPSETEGWLHNHVMNSHQFTDPAKALFFLHSALTQIASKRSMEETIAHSFGVSKHAVSVAGGKTVYQGTERTRALQKQGWREVKGLPHLKGQIFHPDVAHGIERMHEVFKSRSATDGFLHAFEKATSGVKSMMTIYNPAFHPRTMLGEFLLSYLGGVPAHALPRVYHQAAKVLHGRDRELFGEAKSQIGLKTQETKDKIARLLSAGKVNHWPDQPAQDMHMLEQVQKHIDDVGDNIHDANGIGSTIMEHGGESQRIYFKKADGHVTAILALPVHASPSESADLFRYTAPGARGSGFQKALTHHATEDGYDLNTYILNQVDRGQLDMSQHMAKALSSTPGIKLNRRQIRSANLLHSGEFSGRDAVTSGAEKVINTKFGMLSADQIWHHYLQSGVKVGYASSDLVHAGADKALLPSKLRKVTDTAHHQMEVEEDLGRLAHFIYLLKTSKAPSLDEAVTHAAQDVLKYHLDYTAVTRTEHAISSYGVPFYKWLRLSTPLMVETLLHSPGKVMQVPKTLSALSKAAGYDEGQGQGFMPGSPDAMTPDFLKKHGAYPMFGKNTHYFDPTSLFPVAGSVDLLNMRNDANSSTGENVLNTLYDKMNPLITKPLNAGKPNKQSEKDWIANTVPQSRFLNTLKDDPNISPLERLIMFLTNPGFVANTPKKIKSEAYHQRDASYTNRKKRKQQLGIPLK